MRFLDQYQSPKNHVLGPIPQITSGVIPEQHILSSSSSRELMGLQPMLLLNLTQNKFFTIKYQRKEFEVLGLIPDSIKCCSGIGPSILRDQSLNSILRTLGSLPEPNFFMLGSIPDLDWDFSFSQEISTHSRGIGLKAIIAIIKTRT